MEWLINRRRMMYDKALPPKYITFEDSEVWKVICNNYGDFEETVVTDTGNNTVSIITSFVSMRNNLEVKRTVINSQTNVDNSGGTYTVGTTKTPIGITKKQCAAVTSSGVIVLFSGDRLTHRFSEFQYFVGVPAPTRGTNTWFEHIKFPNTLTTIDSYTDWMSSTIIDLPATFTTWTSSNRIGTNIPDNTTLIFRSLNPPALNTGGYNSEANIKKKILKIYVPNSVIDNYKQAAIYSFVADRIESIEGSEYEVFNDWEYDD